MQASSLIKILWNVPSTQAQEKCGLKNDSAFPKRDPNP
jgi:hypothetical protein